MKKGDSRSEMQRMNAKRGLVTGETQLEIAKAVVMPKKTKVRSGREHPGGSPQGVLQEEVRRTTWQLSAGSTQTRRRRK
jgi:hypothetical protein